MSEDSSGTPDTQTSDKPGDEQDKEDIPPSELSVLPMDAFVLFPSMVAPVLIGDDKSKRLVDDALSSQRVIAVVCKRPDGEDLTHFRSLYTVATAANILRMLKMPDGSVRLLLHGTHRVRLVEPLQEEPFLRARIEVLHETPANDTETEALVKNLLGQLSRAVELASLPEDLKTAALNLNDPSKLADMVASNLSLKIAEQQEILELTDVKKRLQRVHFILSRELEVMELGSKIQSQVKSEMDKNQRQYVLREQLKAIRRELGEEEGASQELEELAARIEAKGLPEAARQAADRELRRLRNMQPGAGEYSVARTYLDWILDLPWTESTTDTLDISRAREVLDEDHYGLEKIKERILEYLSVRRMTGDMKGPILCFAGPPGVGKTSLGRSIARALSRRFHRIALGGMRDEAEIRGHRRTYVGAMPGRIIKALKQAGANNPVIMLDEIDKLGADYRGDPSAALLEVLDPEQNYSFTDNYLDLPFDLSRVLFITTANMLDTVPPPLRDRMEVIELPGYTAAEKLAIARKYLVPKQMKENGLTPAHVRFTDAGLRRIIEEYTREAGLRNLEREIGSVCRKVARKAAENSDFRKVTVTAKEVPGFLGPPKFHGDMAERMGMPGVAIGLAWTPVGGEILFIETMMTPGTGKFTLTGQLGEVMRESAQAALTYLRAQAARLGIEDALFTQRDIHIHIPAGAIPKDGPSAGITLAAALASLFTGRRVRNYLAMTGEISLRGNVLPVGGIKEKLLAAARAGVREVILPERNRRDLESLPADARERLKLHFVKHMDEVLALALEEKNARRPHPKAPTGKQR
ncbi:MAG: endopeptidase La [Candidatus Sumerlaeaceae bacterium]|nr:endopeptidase La [Candidatus Sumerlaeaceae bacterium]